MEDDLKGIGDINKNIMAYNILWKGYKYSLIT